MIPEGNPVNSSYEIVSWLAGFGIRALGAAKAIRRLVEGEGASHEGEGANLTVRDEGVRRGVDADARGQGCLERVFLGQEVQPALVHGDEGRGARRIDHEGRPLEVQAVREAARDHGLEAAVARAHPGWQGAPLPGEFREPGSCRSSARCLWIEMFCGELRRFAKICGDCHLPV